MKTLLVATSLGLLLTACSSSSGDGIEPDPASSSAASSTAASGGGEDSDQNLAVLYAWQRFQGEHNTLDQRPLNEDGPTPPERQRCVGCAVDAPELGERLVYVERSTLEGDTAPNRQFLIAFTSDPAEEDPTPASRRIAIGVIYRLLNPSAWTGRCQPGTTLTLLSDVSDSEQCSIRLQSDEQGILKVAGPGFHGICVAATLEGRQISSIMSIGPERVTWTDVDGNWMDPSRDPITGDERWYEFKRRTPLPETSP